MAARTFYMWGTEAQRRKELLQDTGLSPSDECRGGCGLSPWL